MARICKYGFFAQTLLAFQAFAARMNSDSVFEALPLKTALSSRSNAICGGEELWKMMTQSTAIGSIQNIKWAEIEAKADEYISEQAWAKKRLTSELQHLQQRIEEKRKQESQTDMLPDQVSVLVTSGLSDFGGLNEAQRTMCGHPSVRPHAPRSAYRQARETFKNAAITVFNGMVRLDGDTFSKACAAMLPCTQSRCYCEELCQDFRDMAQDLSDTTARTRAGSSADELDMEYSRKAKQLQFHSDEEAKCKQDKQQIMNFGAQIDALKDDIKIKFSKVQDAEEALEQVMWDVTDVEDLLKDQEAQLGQMLQVLKQSGAEFKAAEEKVKNIKDKVVTFLRAVAAGEATLKEATQQLSQGKNANRLVTLLKATVSTIMLRMAFHFQVAVQAPVEAIGWNQYLSLDEYFHKDPSQTRSGRAMKEAVAAMEAHCVGTAMKAFSAVVKTVDLRPLCDFGRVDSIFSDINKAINERTANIREEIEIVVSWLNPYKGQQITKEQVKQYVLAGEPEGLREIINTYGKTKFFGYLTKWSLGSEFLELINKLGKAITDMDMAVQKTNQKLEGLLAGLKSAIKEKEDAAKQLEAAANTLKADKQRTLMAQDAVKKLEEQNVEMNNRLQHLQSQANEANKEWQSAKDKLVESHQQATSFLQALEGESLEVLEQRDAAVAEEVSRLERDLAEAENSKLEAVMGLQRLKYVPAVNDPTM